MRTTQRLTGLQSWFTTKLCSGRILKTPATDMSLAEIATKEPKCYLAWYPSPLRQKQSASSQNVEEKLCPGMIVMPNPSYGKNMEEKRFDRYNGVKRPPELGQTLSVSILFSIYEPGIRMSGYVNNGVLDVSLIEDGTEQGLFTLYNWIDDCVELLLKEKTVPGTDLYVMEESIQYSLYTDQNYVVDKRPIYYGFVNVTFGGYANVGANNSIKKILDNE